MSEGNEKKKHGKPHWKNIIIAIVAAIAIWFSVVYTVNPDISVNISDTAVRVIGEEGLRDNGYVWVNKSKLPGFSVKVSGKRNELIEALDNIRVDIDLSEVKAEGESVITPTVHVPSNIKLEKQRFEDITVACEKLAEKEIPVRIKQIGTTKSRMVKSEPVEKKIKITGSQKQVDSIEACLVNVDITDMVGDVSREYPYVFVDNTNTLIAAHDTIETENEKISVDNLVYYTVTKSVKIENEPELMRDYMITIKSVSPQEMEIGVREDTVLDEITAVFENGDYKDGANEYTLKAQEPNGVYIPDPEIKIKAELEKKQKAFVDITVQPVNLQEGLSVQGMPIILNSEVIGPGDALANVRATVDLSGMGKGYHQVDVKLEDNNITPVTPITINILIE